jgi:hypothetical protein
LRQLYVSCQSAELRLVIVAPHPISRGTEAEAISEFLNRYGAKPVGLMLEGEAGIGKDHFVA